MIVPAQAIEDRNHPHAGRHATFLRENARTLNEPVAKVNSKNSANLELERRWWEWNTVSSATSNEVRRGKRSQSNAPPSSVPYTVDMPNNESGSQGSGFQTTYQKDHGYLKELLIPNANKQTESIPVATRYGSNPNSREAVGIVPINDLNTNSKSGEDQRVFVDKMSFEHQYDSRKDNNYPVVGKVSLHYL